MSRERNLKPLTAEAKRGIPCIAEARLAYHIHTKCRENAGQQ
jgi:hypothetical protein